MLHENYHPIGFYVHTHGHGHAMRVGTIIRHLERPATVLSSFKKPWSGFPDNADYIALDSEDNIKPLWENDDDPPKHLHYIPLGIRGISNRINSIATWISKNQPLLFFVDVSVEIVQLARLCSVPVATPRMHGSRNDLPHLTAYDSASLLIAPFPAWAEQDDTPQWVVDKTIYVGALCRFDSHHQKSIQKPERAYILIILGGDGDILDLSLLISWANEFKQYDIVVLGNYTLTKESATEIPTNVYMKSYVADVYRYIRDAEFVVAPCSDNLTAEITFFGKKWVCIAYHRPFDEQHRKAEILERENIAVYSRSWPDAQQLQKLFSRTSYINFDKQKRYVNRNAGKAIAEAFETFISMKLNKSYIPEVV